MAATGRQQLPREQRREQILRAAGTVFAARGIHAARIEDIAVAAGVGKGTVYWHFSSKDEVVFALVDSFYGQAHNELRAIRDGSGPVLDRLRQYLRGYAALLERHRHLAPLATEFYALAPRNDSVRCFLERYYARWAEAIAVLLDDGNVRGEFTITETASVARSIVEVLDGAFLVWTVTGEAGGLNDRLQATFTLLVNGMEDAGTRCHWR